MAAFVIVDDSKIARNFLRTLLTESGHVIVGEAENGLDGFDAFVKYQPDIITLDITMPIVDGITCLKNIIAKFPNAKIIMVTSVGKNKLIEQAKEIGAKAVILKPFEKEKALSIIDEVIND